MRNIFNKIANYIISNEKISTILFVFLFVSRTFLDLVIEKLFGLGEEWQHYIFSFYKYNYLVILGYMLIYEVFYIYRFHKFHFSKIQWIGITYAFIAIIATYAYLKGKLAFDYYTKLSLGEMIMTSVFMFDVGSKMKVHSFKRPIEFCAYYYILLTFILNVLSLAVLFFNIKDSFHFLGRNITIPTHLDPPVSFFGVQPYEGFYYNTSVAGQCCSLAIFLLIWLLKTKHLNIYQFIILIAPNLYCLFLSANRTGEIGLIAYIMLLLHDYLDSLTKDKKKKTAIYLFYFVILFIALVSILFSKKNISHIFSEFTTDPLLALNDLSSLRLQILTSVLTIVKQRPLLGNGWNSPIPILQDSTIIYFPYAHNVYLGSLAWTGILGFIVLLIFSVTVANTISHNRYILGDKHLVWLVICILLECQFENGIFGDWNHAYTYLFWLVTGFYSTCPRLNSNA